MQEQVNGYEIDKEEIKGWVRRHKIRVLLVQAPDGLKRVALDVLKYVEGLGVQGVLSASPTWGGCDIALDEAKAIRADGIIHIGHHGPVWFQLPSHPPVLFIPAYSSIDPSEAFSRLLEELGKSGVRSISLLTTIQHVKWIPRLKEIAATQNVETRTGVFGGFEGLVVGCNYASLPESEAVVVVAGGLFHAIGAAVWSGLPTWSLDPYTRTYRRIDLEKIAAVRIFSLSRALDASRFLIVVSTKPGQNRIGTAFKVKKALEYKGKNVVIASFNEVSHEQLENLGGFEAYINTACPRLVLDDPEIFPGPSINLGEVKYVLRGSLEGYSLRDSLSFDLTFLEE